MITKYSYQYAVLASTQKEFSYLVWEKMAI